MEIVTDTGNPRIGTCSMGLKGKYLQVNAGSACLVAFLVFGVMLESGCVRNKEKTLFFSGGSYTVTLVGTNKDGFDVPDGILWKDGKLYMADEGGPAFRIWTDAKNVETLSDRDDGILSPEDFVLDREGNIYFTDDDAGGVWKIDTENNTSLLAGKDQGLVSTEGIALSPSGEILVGDGVRHKIFSVDRHGSVSMFLDSGISKPESMVFDEKGNLYIADNHDGVLFMITPGKKLNRLIENVKGFSPESIWYSKGVLYITDSDNGKLFRYSPAEGLKTIAEFGGVWAKVSGVTTDQNGSIYVSVQTHIDDKVSYILRLDERNIADRQE